jgi:hypothetical protein
VDCAGAGHRTQQEYPAGAFGKGCFHSLHRRKVLGGSTAIVRAWSGDGRVSRAAYDAGRLKADAAVVREGGGNRIEVFPLAEDSADWTVTPGKAQRTAAFCKLPPVSRSIKSGVRLTHQFGGSTFVTGRQQFVAGKDFGDFVVS